MKKFIITLAVSLSTVATINAQNIAVDYPYFAGPGINTTANVTKHEPVLAPIHLAAGGYSQYQKVIGWNDRVEAVPVHISGYELEKQGYSWVTPVPDGPRWWWNINSDIPWGWMFFWLVFLAGIALLAWLIIRIVRYSNQPLPAPAATPVTHVHYHEAPIPTQFGPNEGSYEANEINSMITNIKAGKRSGTIKYRNGFESLKIMIDAPAEDATDVSVPSATPPTGPTGENKV